MQRNKKPISKTGLKSTAMKNTSSNPVKVPSITTNPALRDNKDMELNEEWSNFMLRVGEVSNLVRDMASGDKATSDAAHKRADKLLEGKVILDEDVEATVTTDRTVINKKAFKSMGNENPDEMDKEVWMSEMGKDADRRAEDRKVRKEKADTQNTMAIKAFRRGDYQKALSCYNRAIDFIRDNPMFYCDRALTNIKLKNYDKMSKDADRRAEDRKVRKEKADTQNTMTIKAFHRGDYQKALSCYNRAIDFIRDNPMFYCDRALTNIKLKNYDKMSKDADRRAEDRKVRKEKADTQNTMAIKAFRRGDYQKALSCYNRAIDFIRDNPMFYCDRALTNIKLKNYDKVDKDCDLALRLNEDSYKARLYRAKAHFDLETTEFEGYRKELQDLFPQHEDLTLYFLKKNEEDLDEEEEETEN